MELASRSLIYCFKSFLLPLQIPRTIQNGLLYKDKKKIVSAQLHIYHDQITPPVAEQGNRMQLGSFHTYRGHPEPVDFGKVSPGVVYFPYWFANVRVGVETI